jgi:hypothetical protein
LEERVASLAQKTEITALGICCDDHAIPLYSLKLALTSVSIVCSWTKATELIIMGEVKDQKLQPYEIERKISTK